MSSSLYFSSGMGSGGKTSSSFIEKVTPPVSSGKKSPPAETSLRTILPFVIDCNPFMVNGKASLEIAISNS